jgi:hypothetical protein
MHFSLNVNTVTVKILSNLPVISITQKQCSTIYYEFEFLPLNIPRSSIIRIFYTETEILVWL